MSTISIIIPTYNHPDLLTSCLESITRLRYPQKDFEVIVVDDGGNSDLSEIIESTRELINIRVVVQSNAGPAQARNTGARYATGDFIAFTDDDCEPAANWLSALVCRLQKDPSRMYGGYTVNALENNVYSTASQSLISYLYDYYNADPDRSRFFTSNNIAMSRTLFEAVGGFDNHFPGAGGEDREFCDRWLHLGHGMSLVREARIFHKHKMTLRTFCKQHFNYGAGALRFWRCKAMREKEPPKFEPLAFYLGLVSHPWKRKLQHSFALSALMVLSQLANAIGFFWAKFIRG